jgi:hypothetical protein
MNEEDYDDDCTFISSMLLAVYLYNDYYGKGNRESEEIDASEKNRRNLARWRNEQKLKTEVLLESGLATNLNEAKILCNEVRMQRESLEWCRKNSQRYIDQLTDLEFRGLFRVDKVLFASIEERLSKYFADHGKYQKVSPVSPFKGATPVRFLLAGTLRWLAGGSTHDIVYFCGVRIRTFSRSRWDVIAALIDIYYTDQVKLPTNEAERQALSSSFLQKTKMDGVLGAVDGLLVHIRLPDNTRNARPWLCYKSYYALNMQGVAGPDGEFLYVNVGHAGSTGDGCAIRQSQFWVNCMDDLYKYSDGYHFLGDAAYSLMPWLMTPFEGLFTLGGMQDVFNLHLSKGRQVIERAFGMMMKRWRILTTTLEYSVVRCNSIIKCCAMLHNMCLRDRLSRNITVDAPTELRHPFNLNRPGSCLVPRVHVHLPNYRQPGLIVTEEERMKKEEKDLIRAANIKRGLLASQLYGKGNRRQQARGANRAAAYQQAHL